MGTRPYCKLAHSLGGLRDKEVSKYMRVPYKAGTYNCRKLVDHLGYLEGGGFVRDFPEREISKQ